MLGYATGPQDLALGRTADVLRTGDLARRSQDGLFEIVGRRHDFVKIAGLRIDLAQVQRNLTELGLTATCAGRDERLVVAVETGRPVDEVRSVVLGTLDLPPRAVTVLRFAELPRLPSGKPDRVALLSLADAAEEAEAADIPAWLALDAPAASAVASLYQEVLGKPAGPRDSFVSLGGDSLSYVEASLGLEQILGELPAGWARLTVAELGGARGRPTRTRVRARPRRGLRTLETSVVLRAAAILMIVIAHVGLAPMTGGAHVLFAVAGFNFARFQLSDAPRGARLRSQARSIARVVVPAVAWIAAALLLVDGYALHNLFLLNSIVGPPPFTTEWHFWFVEVLVYILVGMAALMAIPAVDRAERRWRFGLPIAVLAVGLAIRFGVLDLGVVQTRPALWLFALGWAASQATRGWQRALILGVSAVALPGFFDDLPRELTIFGGIALLTLVRGIPIPRLAAPALGVLASASLYVYLVHWQVFPHFYDWGQPTAVGASVVAGVVAWKGAQWAGSLLARAWAMLVRRRWPAPLRKGLRTVGA